MAENFRPEAVILGDGPITNANLLNHEAGSISLFQRRECFELCRVIDEP